MQGITTAMAGMSLAFALLGTSPFLLLSLVVPYAMLRARENRSDRPDPQVGLKAALYAFFSLGIVIFLTGLTVVVVDLLLEKPRPVSGLSEAQRNGLALMVAGLLVTLLHLVLVKSMTNDSRSYAARRMFAGWRLAVHGLVVVFALAALMMVLFQKDFGDKELRKAFFGMLLVWFPSWVLHLVLVGFYSRQLYTPSRTGDEWESAG